MPTPAKGARMGGSPAHERLILANLATALFEHGRITTTEAKARRLRPFAERLITKAKRGDLHARRQVMSVIRDKYVVHVLFTEIGPRYDNRHGGYTRITKLGPRKGDAAPMAVIELVEPLAEQTVAEAEAATKRAAKDRSAAGSAAVAPSAGSSVDAADATPGEPGGSEPAGSAAVASSAGSSVDAADATPGEPVTDDEPKDASA
jgi:large subunit ribosomal protein L17